MRIFSAEWLVKLATVLGFNFTKTKWQIRYLNTTITATTADIASMRFSNLTIGKTYRVTLQAYGQTENNQFRYVQMYAQNGANIVASCRFGAPLTAYGVVHGPGTSALFTATATIMTVGVGIQNPSANTFVQGDGTANLTFAQLEEVPNHEVTTQWT